MTAHRWIERATIRNHGFITPVTKAVVILS